MAAFSVHLDATTRQIVGKKVSELRKQGKIPAVLYGHKLSPLNLTLDYTTFEKIYAQAGESTLVDLVIDDKSPVKVLIHDYQLDPRVNQFIHVDFQQVRMDEKIHTEIPLVFTGVAPAVKELGAILVTTIDTLEVECLPGDLVHEITVDLSVLRNFDDTIHVADVTPPLGITIKNAPADVVVLAQAPRTVQELEALQEITPAVAEATAGEGTKAVAAEKTEETAEVTATQTKTKKDK